MIEVRCVDGQFEAKGTFDWGMAGVSENKDFGEGSIEIELDMEELQAVKEYAYWMEPLKELFEGKTFDGDMAAKILEVYYNNLEKKVKEHHTQLKNYFLFRLMENLVGTGYPFWEDDDALLEGFGEVDDEVYDGDWIDEVDKLNDFVYGIEHEGKKMKDFTVDMEAFFKKNLPMFNLEGLLSGIQNEVTSFRGGWVSIQFSDSWDYSYYCSAYEEFTQDLKPEDWHNF